MFGLGYQELLLILVIVLILFGAQRLPDLARSLGSSVKEFKKGVNEVAKEDVTKDVTKKDDATAAAKMDDEKKV
jgi:sec-independent protein translocase protein TatA